MEHMGEKSDVSNSKEEKSSAATICAQTGATGLVRLKELETDSA